MAVNPLPPQAYTKDTLQKAYSWLLSQPSSVKEMAQDQNMLVSLYLKALRNGDAALETPSILNFKQELKSLANMMGDFQSPQQTAQAHTPAHSQAPTLHAAQATSATTHHQQTAPTTSPATTAMNTAAGFDTKTLEAIQHVREVLNLSSDSEALRALVSMGIKQFRKSGIA